MKLDVIYKIVYNIFGVSNVYFELEEGKAMYTKKELYLLITSSLNIVAMLVNVTLCVLRLCGVFC